MMKTVSILLAAGLLGADPAHAATLLSENFDGENGGATALNYADFAKFTVTGHVDLTRSGDYFPCAGNGGACVDLDGSNGPGQLDSIAQFAFHAGDAIRLSFDLSGNQRGGGPDDFYAGFTFGADTQLLDYTYNFFGFDVHDGDVLASSVRTGGFIQDNAPFLTRSISFTAGGDGMLRFNIGTNSGDGVGPILDNVVFSINGVGAPAVPEPASWALMAIGFGLAGVAIRRRTRALRLA